MKKSILSFVAVAALSGAIVQSGNAQEVKVKDGDTLWGISQEYKATIDDIKSWNALSSDTIHPNDILKISLEEYYTIQQGDTLWNIANSYNVSVDEIKDWNGLENDTIHPNQQIVILAEQSHPSTTTKNETTSQPNVAASSKVTDSGTDTSSKAETNNKAETSSEANTSSKADTSNKATKENVTKEITVTATGYTASCTGCSGITKTGINLKKNPDSKVVSVDPSVIPLGSKLYVEGYGYAIAGDTGGAIKGNKVDLFFAEEQDALNWGRKDVKLTVIQ